MPVVNEIAPPLSAIRIEESLTNQEIEPFVLSEADEHTEEVMQKLFRTLGENKTGKTEFKCVAKALAHQIDTPKRTVKPGPKPLQKPKQNKHHPTLNKKEAKQPVKKLSKDLSFKQMERSLPKTAAKTQRFMRSAQANRPPVKSSLHSLVKNASKPSTRTHTPPLPQQKTDSRSQGRPTHKKEAKSVYKRDVSTSKGSTFAKERQSKTEEKHQAVAEQPLFRDKEEREEKKKPPFIDEIEAKKKTDQKPGSVLPFKKPVLERPKMGLFPLYYLLDKLGLYAESKQYSFAKEEVAIVNAKMKKFFKLKIEAMKKTIEQEKESARWGILQKVISWVASAISIVLGVGLILSGVGAIAGALLIAGGLITLISHVMELTGAWAKITHLLPGDDPEKKQAVINWIQIGIAVLSLILGGVGIIAGGFSAISDSMAHVMRLIGAVATMAGGIGAIGMGVSEYLFKNKLADVKEYELKLAILRHRREDLLDILEDGLDRLKRLYEMLCKNLTLEEEVFLSHQMAWK